MKSVCDCVMPEYDCAECPKRVPHEEMVLVGTSKGAPGYSVICSYARYSANGAEAEARLLGQGRNPQWVSQQEARRGIDEYRNWRDAQ